MRAGFRLGLAPWRRLLRSLVLPLLLLAAQQGAVLHELSHFAAAAEVHDSKKQSPRGDVCDLCLAFSQVESGASTHALALPLLAGLSHLLAPRLTAHAADAERPRPRSRGPPFFL